MVVGTAVAGSTCAQVALVPCLDGTLVVDTVTPRAGTLVVALAAETQCAQAQQKS